MLGLVDRFIIKQPRLRRWLTRLLYGGQDRTVQLLGSPLQVNALSENGYLRAARKCNTSSFLRDEVAVMLNLAHFVRPGGIFIDAGANVGVYSTFFAKFTRLYPDFAVHAFEVHPHTLARLHHNATLHGFEVHPQGLSALQQTLEFVAGAVSHVTTEASHTNPASIRQQRFTAACERLDALPWPSQDIILKVDVEGMEYEVLQGAQALFEQRRLCCVYVDGFDDPRVPGLLRQHGMELRDGRTLQALSGHVHALLAVRREPG